MRYYPIALNLSGKNIIVVGGGVIAERKILNLLKAGANIRAISPLLTKKLKLLAGKGIIRWRKGFVHKDDLNGADIVIAATSDRKINEKISRWSRSAKQWVNVVDDQILSDFISPAIFKKQKAIVAVYTDGKDPVLSRDLKNFLKEHWDEFLSYRDRS